MTMTSSSGSGSGTSAIFLPLLVGHESELLPTPSNPLQTHRWTIFVRSVESTRPLDRTLIDKIVFHLHPDFANPIRMVKEPPYQVTEVGYAGFEISVVISLKNVQKKFTITYDMNLSMEKKSTTHIRHILEIRQPGESMIFLLMRFGAFKNPKSEINGILTPKDRTSPPNGQASIPLPTTKSTKPMVKQQTAPIKTERKNSEDDRKKLKVKIRRESSDVDSKTTQSHHGAHIKAQPIDTERLLVLQRRLMRLRDTEALLKAARLLVPLADSQLTEDGNRLEFNLFRLDSSVISQLMEICAAASED